MTGAQLTDQRRTERYIEREGLVSLMNATKWREAEAEITRIVGRWPLWRAATLRSVEPMTQFVHDEYYFQGIPRWVIETLDLDVAQTVEKHVANDTVDNLARSLCRLGVPFTREPGFLRIWGYARPGAFPSFSEFAPT